MSWDPSQKILSKRVISSSNVADLSSKKKRKTQVVGFNNMKVVDDLARSKSDDGVVGKT